MRLALRALLVAVVALVATQSGAAAKTSTPRVVVPESAVFWNLHDGLFAGGRVVERTNNGGRTYRVVLRTRRSVYFLQTVGPRGALVAAYSGETWRTLDGGRTWQRAPSQPTADWLNPRVGLRFHGYTGHDRGGLAMFVTHDGGRTWQRGRTPCESPDIGFHAYADLVTPTSWWVVCVGEGGAGNEDKAIYRTQNGGKTWEGGAAAVRERKRGGVSSYGYPEALAFAPDGWGLLTESRGTLYVSRDGGAHFRAEPHVARPETDFAGGAAAFRGGTGYVLLTNFAGARLIETHDYGRTWNVMRRWRS